MGKMYDVLQTIFRRETPDKVLPVLAYKKEEGCFWTEDGHIGFSLISNPLSGIPEGADEKLANLFNNTMPAESMMQIMLYASPTIGYLKNELHAPVNKSGDDLGRARLFDPDTELSETDHMCKLVIEKKTELMQSGVSNVLETVANTTTRDSVLVVSIKIPIGKSVEPSEQQIKDAKEIERRVRQTFESIGLGLVLMDARSYIRFMHSLLNWSENAYWRTDENLGYDENKFVNQQIIDLDNEIKIDSNGVWLHDTCKRVVAISPRQLPDMFSLFAMSAILGDPRVQNKVMPGNFLFSLNLYWPEVSSTKAAVTQQRNYATYQTFGMMSKFAPKITKRAASYDILFNSMESGERPVKICPTIILFADNEQQAAENASAMTGYYTELGFQMQQDKYLTWPLLVNALPLCIDKNAIGFLRRYSTVAGSHAAQFAPLAGDWKGTGTAVMQFYGRFGQPQFVDLWDSDTNFNLTIAAESGSGKSFLTNDMIMSYLSCQSKVWAIDVGYSYMKLCNAMKGDFLIFSTESNICMNPFPIVENYDEESDMLCGLIMAMAFPTEKPSDYQTGKLKEVMKNLWDAKGKSMTIDDISQNCKEDQDPARRLKDIGEQLFPFTSRGEYGRFFVGENNVKFDNNFTVLELEELKGREHLQQVVLLQLIYQIQQSMYLGSRKFRKMVIIDEAWDLLSKGNVAKFMESGYRRFRKYNGCAVTITQSINDLYKNAAGVAIAENSANMILLGQKRESIESIKREKRIALSDGTFELLKSVRSVRGVFSEIFFYMNGGKNSGVGRLIVDRFTQLLYSTHPDDINAIESRVDAGMTSHEAILDVIKSEKRR